ncbi:MAG: signal peptidase I [Planctomycetota bacterium]
MSWRNSSPDEPPGRGGISPPFAERIEFFEAILRRGADVRVRVTGRSMAPFLRDGDIVTLRAVPFSSLRWGDVIFFRNAEGLAVMHRIVRWRRRGGAALVQTAGDAAACLDPPVSEGNVLGKVRLVERQRDGLGGRRIDMQAGRWRAMNSFLALVSLARAGLRRMRRKLGIVPKS